nr:MAG TPA: hypothetical protein [Caudoviricetes sp.]
MWRCVISGTLCNFFLDYSCSSDCIFSQWRSSLCYHNERYSLYGFFIYEVLPRSCPSQGVDRYSHFYSRHFIDHRLFQGPE